MAASSLTAHQWVMDARTCSKIWDARDARFGAGCFSLAALVPSGVAILVLATYILRHFVGKQLPWISNFAAEEKCSRDDIEAPAPRRWNHWTLILGILSIIGLIFRAGTSLFPPWWPYGFMALSPWVVSLFIIVCDRPRSLSYFLVPIFFTLSLVHLSLLLLSTQVPYRPWILHLVECCAAIGSFVVTLAMPIRDPHLEAFGIAQPFGVTTHELRSPEDNLSLWQFLSVSWMTPLISLGSSRQIRDEDVWLLPFEFQHERLHNLFRELPGSILGRLIKANFLDLVITILLGVFESAANFSTPMLLQQLLVSIETLGTSPRPAIVYAAIMLVIRLAAAQSGVLSLWYSRRCYERSRGEMITMVYEKTLSRKAFGSKRNNEGSELENGASSPIVSDEQDHLKSQQNWVSYLTFPWRFIVSKVKGDVTDAKTKSTLTESQQQPATMGKILNLMRNDVYEVAQRFWEFPTVVTKPLNFILAVVLIWKLLGWPSLVGMFTVILAQVVNAGLIRGFLRNERIRRAATDVRLNLTSQFVEALRHLRWYDWQDHWLSNIMLSRQRELHLRVWSGLWNAGIAFMNILASGMFPVAAFYAYTVLAGQELRVDVAFPALQLFNMLDVSLKELPGLITVLLNARIAMGRIEEFMDEPDKLEVQDEAPLEVMVPEFRDASFAWPGYMTNVLENISVRFPPGLTVICGRVGGGKSALLQAILGELDLRGGDFTRLVEMAGYCGQTPWLQSMSIRDNIIFCAPFENDRYKQVLDACALIPDLANFKHGDLSNLGENGIGLSGGQRARVALARAVYSRARILLLDDPLAALDQGTAELIVKKLLCGPLVRGRVVILATHRIDLCLHLADQVIEVTEGRARVIDRNETVLGVQPIENNQDQQHDEDPGVLDEQESAAIAEAFIEEERRAHGSVLFSVYWRYVKAGGFTLWSALILGFVVFRLVRLGNYWFLKEWGEAYGREKQITLQDLLDRLPSPQKDLQPWLLIFMAFALVQAIAFLFSEFVLIIITYTAGKSLFEHVMERVCGAPFRFYDVTPVGRLMNRLTSDFGTLDGSISQRLIDVAWEAISWAASIAVIASITPLFVAFSALLTVWFIYTFRVFLPTSQSLRRLEMVSLTPLMSNFGALLAGLTTVRAFRAQPQFQDRLIQVVDNFQKMDHFYWSLQAWLMYRFDIISAISTFVLTLIALWEDLSPGLTAFVLTTAANFVTSTHSLCKLYGQLQMDFVSVERVIELLDLDQESVGAIEPPASWPRYGDDIVFEDATITYAKHLDPALQNITLRIPGKSKTAVIGRTGSGKSTLALSLLATVLPESGKIIIGGVDTSKVDVHALRQRITFVAQDPVLFNGDIRKNLDPLSEHSEEECESVLHRVLGEDWQLSKEIEGGGRNLSQGQRQLIGLGRAILRRSPIIILDEATASIDKETAAEIQDILHEELKDCTVVTVAHRLEAVKNADYCIVLDRGKVSAAGSAEDVLRSQVPADTSA